MNDDVQVAVFAAAPAGRALATQFQARAFADAAGQVHFDGAGPGRAAERHAPFQRRGDHVGQRKRDLHFAVFAAGRAAAAAEEVAGAEAACRTAHVAEDGLEELAETAAVAEFHLNAAALSADLLGGFPVGAEGVVFLAFCRIVQHFVRFVHVFVLLLRAGGLVHVGMVLLRQFAVRAFYFLFRGGLGHAENFVIISVGYAHSRTPPLVRAILVV